MTASTVDKYNRADNHATVLTIGPWTDEWLQEKDHVLGELKMKATMTTETLNAIEGVTCNEVMGAMYAFPRVHLPEKAIAAAQVRQQPQS